MTSFEKDLWFASLPILIIVGIALVVWFLEWLE